MNAFQTPLDIADRACQHIGARRLQPTGINTLALWAAAQTQEAAETYFAYDKCRQSELRRNLWVFSTRKVALRALDTTSTLLNFDAAAWQSGFTYIDGTNGYPAGSIASYVGQVWVSLINGNVATPGVLPSPGDPLAWDSYFGSPIANAWNDSIQNTSTTNNTSYHVGEIVYMLAGGLYISIVEGNQNEPDLVDDWSDTILYYNTSQVVIYNGVTYQNTQTINFNNEPDTSPTFWTTTITAPEVSNSWITLNQTASGLMTPNAIVYPLMAGPASDSMTNNAFRLPYGFLRPAQQSPKAGARAWLGAHVGLPYSDLTYEGLYVTGTSYRSELMLRFIADVQDVSTMDAMFCEGLGARIGQEIAPRIDPTKIGDCQAAYKTAMSEARTVDAIEAGPTEQDEDEWITVRL